MPQNRFDQKLAPAREGEELRPALIRVGEGSQEQVRLLAGAQNTLEVAQSALRVERIAQGREQLEQKLGIVARKRGVQGQGLEISGHAYLIADADQGEKVFRRGCGGSSGQEFFDMGKSRVLFNPNAHMTSPRKTHEGLAHRISRIRRRLVKGRILLRSGQP